jgi:hypothetical protein
MLLVKVSLSLSIISSDLPLTNPSHPMQSLLALATLLPFTTALPASLLDRAACVDTCGRSCYWESDITAAQNKGYSLYQSGQTEGSNKYPHSENNYEGFDFPVDGPYLEFPILSTFKVYTGGSPGPDRVVFNTANEWLGWSRILELVEMISFSVRRTEAE